ncbi:phage tailspike protein, partial [Escherichia coli]|uniref:phage tailspike protein n=1 Tax=Escherichia coli TaxID=562 RepID=UPI002FEEDBD5
MTDSINANVVVSMPSQLFTMARSFKAVANGKIYIGKIDTDPVNPENQIQVYVENEDGSHVPVSQPIIINAAGYPVYNGQIAKFVTVQGHSMAVYDAYGAQQFYFPNILKYDPDQFKQELENKFNNGSTPSIINYKYGLPEEVEGATQRTLQDKLDDHVNVRDFGAKGDGITDDTYAITNAIIYCASNRKRLKWDSGVYLISRIKCGGDNYNYDWVADGKVVLKSTAKEPLGPNWIDDYFIRLEGGDATPIDYNSTINPGDTSISINSAYSVDAGDIIMIHGNRLIQTDNRGQACEGEMHVVTAFDNATKKAEISGAFYFFYSASNDYSTTVTASVSGGEFSFGNDVTLTKQYNQVKVTGVTGANAGTSRYITHWDYDTKTAKFEYAQGPFPFKPSVGDVFKITRKANIYKRKPCYGRIVGDFNFERPVTQNASPGDLGFRGLVIDGAVDMHIEGIKLIGFSETGIFLESCYRTKIIEPYIEYSNRAYDLTNGTGYGVEIYNSSYCTVVDMIAFACRRGLDVSGTQMVSLYNNIINPTMMGGGTAYDGVKFFPDGDTRNSCCGGHGPSYETTFSGGNSVNLYYAGVIRGLNEVYDGMNARGFSGPAPFFVR